MVYVVEIESPNGETATKEYEATSLREVVRRVKIELRDYPGFHLLHVSSIDTADIDINSGAILAA